jgi:hypothetical protein
VLLVAGRQGGPTPITDAGASDMDGIELNVAQYGDPGFVAGIEMVVNRFDQTTPFNNTYGIGIQIGVIDPFGKNGEQGLGRYAGVNRATYGVVATASVGANTRAFFAQSTTTGTWEDYLHLRGATGVPFLSMPRTVAGLSDNGAIRIGPRPIGGTPTSYTIAYDNAGSLVIFNAAETQEILTLNQTGAIAIGGNMNAAGFLVTGTAVVGARNTGWGAMTGTTNKATVYDTSSVTLAQLAGRVMALQAALTTHGLIGA